MVSLSLFDYPWGKNLGDAVQSYIFLRYIESAYSDISIQRIGRDFPLANHLTGSDELYGLSEKEKIILESYPLIQCGWISQNPIRYISLLRRSRAAMGVHISTGWTYTQPKLFFRDLFESSTFRSFFGQLNTIYTRDLESLNFLAEIGIKARFLGCVSSMAGLLNFPKLPESTGFLIVDMPEIDRKKVAQGDRGKFVYVSNRLRGNEQEAMRQKLVNLLLSRIQSAELVVTSRLHVALPAMSLGRPCILVISENDPRIQGLESVLNIMNPEKYKLLSFNELKEFANNDQKYGIISMQSEIKNSLDQELPKLGNSQFYRWDSDDSMIYDILAEIVDARKTNLISTRESNNEKGADRSNFFVNLLTGLKKF